MGTMISNHLLMVGMKDLVLVSLLLEEINFMAVEELMMVMQLMAP